MDDLHVAKLHDSMVQCGIFFERGLSDSEIEEVERRYGFRFPPDLRSFLQHGMPSSRHFPNWRAACDSELKHCLDWPLEGILFDVQNNAFWLPTWGVRPPDPEQAISLAAAHVLNAPRLIPVYSCRYISSEPFAAGNPVFSVHQSDVLRYRSTLASFFAAEFGFAAPEGLVAFPRRIRFWDELMCFNKDVLGRSLQIA